MARTLWILFLALMTVAVSWGRSMDFSTTEQIQEYCEHEGFHPQCAENEVVVITHARYGRMRLGRCIQTAYNTLGCSTNVLAFLDKSCSGRRTCDVELAKIINQDDAPCPTDLRGYLEAAYACVQVAYASRSGCRTVGALEIRSQHGFLSSLVAQETGCGSRSSPWWITAARGQQLRLRLWDFGGASDADARSGAACHVLALIKEESTDATRTVCAGATRETLTYTSSANKVEVRIFTRSTPSSEEESSKHFLIEFEAFGCIDPTPPKDGWVRRTGNEAHMGCNATGAHAQWAMQCTDTEWIGDLRNCTTEKPADADSAVNMLTDFQGLFIVIIIGIAVSLGLCILLLGAIYIRKNRRRAETINRVEMVPRADRRSPKPVHESLLEIGKDGHCYFCPESDYYRTRQTRRQRPPRTGRSIIHTPLPPIPAHAPPGTPEPAETSAAAGNIYKDERSMRRHRDPDEPPPVSNTEERKYYVLDPDYIASKLMETELN